MVWVGTRQDTINKGRRGTKEKCLATAEAAIAKGSSVLIDRTNVTADQRQPFLALAARLGASAHAVSSLGGSPSRITSLLQFLGHLRCLSID